MEIVLLTLGLFVGFGAAWFIARYKFSSDHQSDSSALLLEQEKTKSEQEKTKGALLQVSELKIELETQRKTVLELNNKLSGTTADYRNLQEKLNDQNKTNLSEILNPLKEKIVDFEKKVGQTNKESIDRNSAMREQLTNLKELNQQ